MIQLLAQYFIVRIMIKKSAFRGAYPGHRTDSINQAHAMKYRSYPGRQTTKRRPLSQGPGSEWAFIYSTRPQGTKAGQNGISNSVRLVNLNAKGPCPRNHRPHPDQSRAHDGHKQAQIHVFNAFFLYKIQNNSYCFTMIKPLRNFKMSSGFSLTSQSVFCYS